MFSLFRIFKPKFFHHPAVKAVSWAFAMLKKPSQKTHDTSLKVIDFIEEWRNVL